MEMNDTVKALEMRVAQSGRVMEWFEYIQGYVTTGNRVELLAALTKAPFLKDLSLDAIAMASRTHSCSGCRWMEAPEVYALV